MSSQLPPREVYKLIDGFEKKAEFFEFARGYLDIKDNQINDIRDDYSDSREQKYQTICLWKRKTGRRATIERLRQLKAEFDAPLDDDENTVDGSSSNEVEQPNMSPSTPPNKHVPTTVHGEPSAQLQSASVSSAPSQSSSVTAPASEVSHQQSSKSHQTATKLPYQKPGSFAEVPVSHRGPTVEGSSSDDVSLLKLSIHTRTSEAPGQQPHHPSTVTPVDDASSAFNEGLLPNSEEWLKNKLANKMFPEPTSKAWGSPPEAKRSSTSKSGINDSYELARNETEIDNNIPDQLGAAANPDISRFCDEVGNLKVETCSPEEKRTIDAKDNVYEIKNKPKGYVLIINNNFKETKGYRVGAENDVKNMKELWLSLECAVNVQQDKSADEVRTILQKIAKSENTKKYDFFVVFIMSHGRLTREGEAFKTADGKYLRVEEVLQIFDTKNSLNLIGKPKLFFFQFCRGKETDKGFSSDDQEFETELYSNMHKATKSDSDLVQQDTYGDVHPIRCDLFISYATQLGFRSFRNHKGSWFINAIANVFARYAKEEHVTEMMVRVREAVRAKTGITPQTETANIRCKEMSESRDLLSKRLYLLPGYPEDDLL